jgi:dipeptidyl aminopeptidase/acylaminoacyl peptidase
MACVIRAVLTACGLFLLTPSLAQSQPLPAEAFGRLPAISQLQLSPDGKHLAAIQSFNGHSTPIIYQTDALRDGNPVVLPTADWTIDNFVWANRARLIMVVKKTFRAQGDSEPHTWLRAIAVNVDGTRPVVLLNKQRGYANNHFAADIVNVDLGDPNHAYAALLVPDLSSLPSKLALGRFENVVYRLDLLKVDVNTGESSTLEHGNPNTILWLMDGHAHAIARVDQDKRPLLDHVMVKRSGTWIELANYDATSGKGAGIIGLTMDGASLVRLETIGETGTRGLTRISIADGKTSVLFDDPNHDVNLPQTEPWTGRIIGASVVEDQEKYHFFDPQLQALQDGLEASFPGAAVYLASWDAALDKLVVQVSGARLPPVFYLIDHTTHKADILGNTYPGIRDKDLGPVAPYPYKARDGLNIHAYLTLPPGKPPKRLPTVIMPHGGPGERNRMQFDWLAQFLATRGYAVLQPNFRGSIGYGEQFKEAGYGEWGLKMQDDITDGIKRLIADGIADPKRICIFGASYGGYAALAGATFTPDLYACAASWAAVTDPKKFLASRADEFGENSAAYSSWASFINGRDRTPEQLDATSPVRHADQIKCPVLLLYGTADTTVPIDQSEDMNNALRSAGKKVELVKIDGETHYMESADTRVHVLGALEKFLSTNIGN